MLLLALVACGVDCRTPDPVLTCSAAAMDPDRRPVTDPSEPVRGWFGIQGGAHVEIALDLAGTSPTPEIGVEVFTADGTLVSTYGPIATPVEIADADTCESATVRLEVPFEAAEDICDLDGESLRFVVSVVRRDEQATTCETAGILASDDVALDVFCSPPS